MVEQPKGQTEEHHNFGPDLYTAVQSINGTEELHMPPRNDPEGTVEFE